MSPAAHTLRAARRRAGLTQAEVARRLGSTQSAVAQLERSDANPTIRTLRRALRATGHDLRLCAEPREPNVDEDQIARQLARTPTERLASFTTAYRNVRQLVQANRPPG
jgi:transcriptional regulator with XRE-family HTH domain